MGKKKTTQEQKVTNTYGWQAPPETPDTTSYREQVRQGADFSSPLIHAYARAGDVIQNQAFEDEMPKNMRDRIKRSQLFDLEMDRGAALGAAKAQEHIYNTGQAGSLASMTQPRLVQTGGNSSGTMVQSGSGMWLDPVLSGAASVGGAALMA